MNFSTFHSLKKSLLILIFLQGTSFSLFASKKIDPSCLKILRLVFTESQSTPSQEVTDFFHFVYFPLFQKEGLQTEQIDGAQILHNIKTKKNTIIFECNNLKVVKKIHLVPFDTNFAIVKNKQAHNLILSLKMSTREKREVVQFFLQDCFILSGF